MSGIFSSLQATATTIQAHSKSVELAGRNIAHMNDPNYARQRVIYGSTVTIQTQQGPQSSALTALGFEQIRDSLLDTQVLAEISHQKGLESGLLNLKRALAALGDNIDRMNDAQFIDDITSSGGSLRESIGNFFNAFEGFSARPNDPTTKQILLQQAQSLTEEFNRVNGRMENIERAIEEQIDDDVIRINRHLSDLDNLNKEIAKLELARPNSALDLRDQRQAKLEQLAELMSFNVVEEAGNHGMVSIIVGADDGTRHALVAPGKQVNRVAVNEDGQITTVLNRDLVLDIQSGSLQSAIDIRDNHIHTLRSNMDKLVESLVTEVNAVYSATGNDFFEATGLTSASFRLASDLNFNTLLASATGLSGANEIARDIADLTGNEIAALDGNTFTQYAARLVTDLAQNVQDQGNRLNVQTSVRELIQSRRDEISGVSLDEEMSHMLLFQRAFQASSRVFNTLDEMLNQLVNQVGIR
ncbi:MAG: flagellar hook-associated protein FlgK [Opitutales bacterium]|nr:flagellar hook-associated protein FlgK [Opitutales bacterium]